MTALDDVPTAAPMAAPMAAPTRPRRDRTALAGWLTAQIISLTGTRLSMIAVPWFVLTTTGSVTRTGLVAFAEMTPYVLVKALGGPLLDRIGARQVSVAADLGSVVAVGVIPLLSGPGRLPFGVLLAAVALAGALRGPGDGAKLALVPGIASASRVPLERVTGLANAAERLAGMGGAAVGGVLIAALGAPFALWLDAASFAVAAVLIAATTSDQGRDGGRDDVQTDDRYAPETVAGNYFSQLRGGWRFLRRDQVLMAITVTVAVTNLFDQAYIAVLLPAWALVSGGGSSEIGLILAMFGGASAVGSVIAAGVGSRLPRYATYFVAFLLGGAPRFIVLGRPEPLVAILVVAVVGGFSSGFLNPILGAVIFERVPAAMVGRVTSLLSALCWVLIPFGGLVGGLTIDRFGLSAALIACGMGYFATTMLPALLPRWREINHRPA
jgi:MFS family permease